MNDDLAYLLGLIIGGGIAEPRSISIEFPYQYLRIVLSFSMKSTDIGYRLG